MRIRSFAALAGVLALTTACSSASSTATPAPAPAPAPAAAAPVRAPAAAVNPVGRWTVALTAQGQAFDLVMELRLIQGDEFGGVINSQALPPIPINKATRTGNSMRIAITAPTGDEAVINITFEGDTFSGEWSMPGDGSRVSGRRIVQ